MYIIDDIKEAIFKEGDPNKACCLNVSHAVARLKKEYSAHPEAGDVGNRRGSIRHLHWEGKLDLENINGDRAFIYAFYRLC